MTRLTKRPEGEIDSRAAELARVRARARNARGGGIVLLRDGFQRRRESASSYDASDAADWQGARAATDPPSSSIPDRGGPSHAHAQSSVASSKP
jgi:hypothetical protein